jgi:hypothetical protein
MSRTIKFRAWFAPEKLMCDWDFILSQMSVYEKPFESTDEWKVMQFTGLHDKSGKEVYEGDIVKKESNGDLRVVSFKDGIFAPYPWTYGGWNEVSEVIGNIYENPELLNEKEV